MPFYDHFPELISFIFYINIEQEEQSVLPFQNRKKMKEEK